MKKLLTMALVFVLVSMVAITTVKAVSGATIVDDVYALGKKYGLTEADKARADRYVADNPITDEEAATIYAKAQESIKILEEAGATDVKKLDTQLNAEQRAAFEAKCQEAASVIGLTLTYNNGNVEVYKDGKKIDTFTFTDGKLAYTGNSSNIGMVVGSSVAVVALIAVAFVARKKFIND